MNETLLYIIKHLAPIVTFFFIARFLLQASRADFYNPISQGIVKLTDPVLKPLRMLAPSMGRWDIAALIAAFLLEAGFLYAQFAVSGSTSPGLLALLIVGVFSGVGMLLTVVSYLIIIHIVGNLLAAFGGMQIQHPLLNLIDQIIEPIMAPARKLLPPIGGFDLSPILVFFVLGLVSNSILPQLQFGILGAL